MVALITGNVVKRLRRVVDEYSSHDQHDTTPPTGILIWNVDLVIICSHDLCDVAEGWAR
jgi:hypothetical protein